jgi:hypothetical protein
MRPILVKPETQVNGSVARDLCFLILRINDDFV